MIINEDGISCFEKQKIEKSRNTILKLRDKADYLYKAGYRANTIYKVKSCSQAEIKIIKGILLDYQES